MTFRQFLLVDLLVLFLALTVYVLETVGYVGFFREAFASPATILMAVDLTLSLGLVLVWMWGDAKTSGVPLLPYAIVAATIGAAGPLGYLLHREVKARRGAAVGRAVQA